MGCGIQKGIPKKVSPGPILKSRNVLGRWQGVEGTMRRETPGSMVLTATNLQFWDGGA